MANIRLSVPKTAKSGELLELKALIQHPMESGFRRGSRGEVIERNIITRFECLFNDDLFFASDFHPAVAANPILTFHAIVEESGEFLFRWVDQHGEVWSDRARIDVV